MKKFFIACLVCVFFLTIFVLKYHDRPKSYARVQYPNNVIDTIYSDDTIPPYPTGTTVFVRTIVQYARRFKSTYKDMRPTYDRHIGYGCIDTIEPAQILSICNPKAKK